MAVLWPLWTYPDSNREPSPCKSVALPLELQAQNPVAYLLVGLLQAHGAIYSTGAYAAACRPIEI